MDAECDQYFENRFHIKKDLVLVKINEPPLQYSIGCVVEIQKTKQSKIEEHYKSK
jgi:hypothetical protein